jgi:hypothetical protein
MVGYLKNVCNPVETANYWESVKYQDVSLIANSNGLRGWEERNFYNKKGYEVVFNKIDEITKGNPDLELETLLEKYMKHDAATSHQLIATDKINLKKTENNLIFHIVHKIQRGGGREIFCMDLDTKSVQNPIEKMMKYLCKRVPNEFISIPSNKRHGLIHTDFYEKKINRETNHVYRWVLDCRRWAPHSVFQKYVYFLEGMSPLLPADFIRTFRDFAEKMFKKKFLTREHVYNKLKNNVKFSEYSSLLKASSLVSKTYELTVKFSFVMGIFNYLSTLMHAANQIVAGEIIRNQCIFKGEGLVILDPKCHSDDSVVSSYHEKSVSLKRSLILYDWMLKGANHMLSVKKSQVNEDVYLEFLSVLYLFDRFLPVLPKFTSSLPFKPSDKGYSADVSFAVTQAIEMLTQGGSYEEAFIMMKLTERFIQKCYRINIVQGLPYQMLGVLDSHPIELLYSGGMADAYRCMSYNPKSFWLAYSFLLRLKVLDVDKGDISLRWDMSSRISGGPKDLIQKYNPLLEKLSETCAWTVSNMKLGNGHLNLLWYVNKLKDKMFYSSLVNEPAARRYARIFGSGGYRDLLGVDNTRYSVTKVGLSLSAYIDSETEHTPVQVLQEFMRFCCRDLEYFYRSLDGATIETVESANQKEKPVVFYQGLPTLGNVSISAAEYVSYVREPKGYLLLGKRANPMRECAKISTQLDLMGVDAESLSNDQLYAVARKITRDEQKTFRLIMPMPGDQRKIEGYTEAVNSLVYNSFKWKRILIRARNTTVVDWSRRMIGGKMPESVTNFLKVYWFEDLCRRYGVSHFDIFLPYQKLEELKAAVPDEWKAVLNAEMEPHKCLVDMPYWVCWTKEQVKLGKNWYGSGECYMSVPEALFEFKVLNGRISSIRMQSQHSGPFSIATNWYLNVFFFYSGLTSDVVPSEFGDPSSLYLGQDSNGNYRIGRPNLFAQVYIDSTVAMNVLPGFARQELPYTKRGATVIYHGRGRDYKVNFFIPLDQPVVLDLAAYIDKEKLKHILPNEPKLNDFVQDYATSVLGYSKKDINFLRRNLDSSLLYNVIYNFSEKLHVFDGMSVQLPLMGAVREWKEGHPGFGFPNDENLSILAKSGDIAPLSPKMMDFVRKLGMMEMQKIEFDTIMAKLLSLPNVDRERYLINMYPHLLDDQQAGSLVVLKKSTRIFKSCALVRTGQYSLLIDFVKLINEAVLMSGIESPTLTQWASDLRSSYSNRITPQMLLESAVATFLVDSAQTENDYAKNFNSAGLLMQVAKELLDVGLSSWLNVASLQDPLFRSVEFKTDHDQVLRWLNDLMDNCTLSIGPHPSEFLTYQNLVGEARGKIKRGFYEGKWTKIGGYLSRIDYSRPDTTLVLLNRRKVSEVNKYGFKVPNSKKSLKTLSLTRDTKPGIAVEPFLPLDEEWQDEFDEAWEYEDQYDSYERDVDADIPKESYVYLAELSIKNLTRVRGTAWNLYIVFDHLNPDITKSADKLTFYARKGEAERRNLYNFCMQPRGRMLCRIGSKNVTWVPQNYEKIPWEKVRQMLRSHYEMANELEIEGEKYDKKEVVSDPSLSQYIPNLDSYFKRMSQGTAEVAIKENETVLEFATANLFLSPEYTSEKEKLDEMLLSYRHSKKEKEEKEEEDEKKVEVEEISEPKKKKPFSLNMLQEILEMQSGLLDKIGGSITDSGSGGSLLVDRQNKFYNFKEPTDLLTDTGFKSEFETFFPGTWESLNKKEISLTRSQKADRLTLARIKISRMSGEEKRNYTMLYQILMFVLSELPERGGIPNMSNAFIVHVDSLFEVEDQDITEDGLASFNQIFAKPVMLIPEDIDLL